MKITALLHASFEGLGAIAEWATRRATAIEIVRLYAGELPNDVDCDLLVVMGGPLNVFHWHGDTFEIPAGALHLERSAACERQSFLWGDRVLGLQYHLEMTPQGITAIVAAGAAELAPSTTVRPAEELAATADDLRSAHGRLGRFLEALTEP